MIDRDRDLHEFARVLALSDAIFGVAMTLLVISIVIPVGLAADEFSQALLALIPRIGIMGLSIAVAASAWLTHHRLFTAVQRIDPGLLNWNFVLLGLVALIPLPHQVLGEYPYEPLAYVLYAVVLASVNGVTIAMDLHVQRRGLAREAPAGYDHQLETQRGILVVSGFLVSIPLAFALVAWTPLIWIALLPLDRLLVARARRRRAEAVPAQ
jgi:uncharacterized membrane protein